MFLRSSHLVPAAMVLLAGVALAQSTTPQAGRGSPTAPAVQSTTGGSVDHGRYIVHEIAMCGQCHSPRDEHGNLLASREFDGGPVPFRPPWPNDWAIYAPRNKGLPGYDDAQAIRLLTEGAIGRDGRQLKLPMPRFHMSKQDAADVIAYMRSLQ
jgi:mono/diheme cytochrome c family protein